MQSKQKFLHAFFVEKFHIIDWSRNFPHDHLQKMAQIRIDIPVFGDYPSRIFTGQINIQKRIQSQISRVFLLIPSDKSSKLTCEITYVSIVENLLNRNFEKMKSTA